MSRYPDTVQFNRLNRPIGIEWTARNLEVQGSIPAEIDGAFFRAVPDPAHAPRDPGDVALSGDGMVSRFRISNGAMDHDLRYVHTARFEAERKARKALFGKYRNPFTDLPEVQGVDRTVSNTTPIWHAGRLLMTKEDGRAYEVNPHTLQTLGSYDFGGKLRSQTMTAHVRVDPVTGELFSFGYEAGGTCSDQVAYWIADKDGSLVSEQWFAQPYLSTIHDFAITEDYALFPLFPTLTDLDRLKAGGDKWVHDPQGDSWLGVMPRYGKVEELRWFKGPKGVSAFHFVNAFQVGQTVHVDICLTNTNAFPFMHGPDDPFDPRTMTGGLTRWSVDLADPNATLQQRVIGPPGDLPRLRDCDQGRAYQHVWLPTYDPRIGPPVSGGPVGSCFNCLLLVDVTTGQVVDALARGPGVAFNEPVHVPSSTPGHAGYILAVIDYELDFEHHRSELVILQADRISAPPLATVPMPVPLRPQVHGWWVSGAQLAAAKAGPAI